MVAYSLSCIGAAARLNVQLYVEISGHEMWQPNHWRNKPPLMQRLRKRPRIQGGVSMFGALFIVKRAEVPLTRLRNSLTLLSQWNPLFTSPQVLRLGRNFARRTIHRGEMRPLYRPSCPSPASRLRLVPVPSESALR